MAVEKRKGPSLETKLPLMIAALLLGLVLVGFILAYYQVHSLSIEGRAVRLEAASRQLAELVDESARTRRSQLMEAAEDSAVQAYFLRPDRADVEAARSVLASLDAGPEVVARVLSREPEWKLDLAIEAFPDGWSAAQADSARRIRSVPSGGGYSELVTVGGERFVWALAPVVHDGRVLGAVGVLRTVAQSSSSPMRQLIGHGSQFYFVNLTGGNWITLDGEILPAPVEPAPLIPTIYRHPDGTRFLGHGTMTESGGFAVVAEFPMSEVLARPHAFARQTAVAALLLFLVGIAGAWGVSRGITRPLRALVRASRAVADGDYSQRVLTDREDELGDLARSFGRMAREVESAQEELRERYEEAREMAATIEAANRQLTEAVEQSRRSREEAEAANEAKSDFLATMSHELRTPINAIIGYTDLLYLEIPGALNSEQKAQLERIRTNGQHLVTLIGEVLDLARVESGKVRVERRPERLGAAIEQALAIVSPDAARRNLRFVPFPNHDPDAWYRGDEERVRQILVNLLSNAIKFTEPGGIIEIGALRNGLRSGAAGRRESPDGDGGGVATVSVTVRDRGPGIPEEELEEIFEPFVQGRNRTEEGGVGLGLSISRRLARLMGGELTAASEPGGGSAFTLVLPVSSPPDPPVRGEVNRPVVSLDRASGGAPPSA